MSLYNYRSAGIVFALSLTMVSFQNCAQKNFTEIPSEEKNAKLAGESVFGPNSASLPGQGGAGDDSSIPGTGNTGTNNGTGFGDNTLPGMGMGGGNGSILTGGSVGSGNPNSYGNSYVDVKILNLDAPSNPDQLSLKYVCSDQRSNRWGNVAASSSLTVDLLAKEGNALVSKCSFASTDLRQIILEQKRIPTGLLNQHCGAIAAGDYVFNIRDTARLASTSIISADYENGYLKDANKKMKNAFVVTKGEFWSTSEPYLHIYTDRNPDKDSPDGKQDMIALAPERCDSKASPLVIHMQAAKDRPEHLIFTSPAKGIDFDILGANSVDRAGNPSPHEKKRISWHRSQQYVYIVLPNAAGKVEGIDEMFGDNTKGPDGKFAANGYEALSKWDDSKDGYIDSKDAIYSRLRIWRDENFDGISQAQELYRMDQFGIKTVDLNYDPKYYEMDKWGNEVKYKSVVQAKDGKLYLMFDVWFNHYTK